MGRALVWLGCLAVLVGLGGQAAAVTTSIFDEFGTTPYAWIHVGGYETLDPVLMDSYEDTWTFGPVPVGSAYGLGDVSVGHAATAKALSALVTHDPFGNGELSIGADVETWKPFQVVSDTLPAGTPVPVTLGIGCQGSLEVKEQTADKTSAAHASFLLTLYDKTQAQLGSSAGSASVTGDSSSSYTLEDTADWSGLLAPAGDGLYTLDFQKVIPFDAVVGETYWLYFELSTGVDASGGAAVGGATQVEANFRDTATYALTSTADVRFENVPEPATLGLLALGASAMIRRRRLAN